MPKQDNSLKSIIPGAAIGARVQKSKRYPYGDINRALGKWKRALKDSGKIESLKDNKEFTKPSIIRRQEINKAKYMQQVQDANRGW
jgi:small subunit ribosomal protein S21